MVSLILSIVLELIPNTKVGIYAPDIRDPYRVAEAISWIQRPIPVLVTNSDPSEVIRILADDYCMTVRVIAPKRSHFVYHLVSDNQKFGKLNRLYSRAQKGQPVFIAGIEEAEKATYLARALKTQFVINGEEGSLNVGHLQRGCW